MIPQRTLAAECEISTGSLVVTSVPPLYTGEAFALAVQITLKNNGTNYSPPSGVSAEMYLYFPNTENMTQAVAMTIENNVLTGVLPASSTGIGGYPLLIIQLIDTSNSDLIVAAHYPLKMIKSRGKNIVSTEAPSPSQVIYIGRSPYINSTTNTWMVWNDSMHQYEDSGINVTSNNIFYENDHILKIGSSSNTNDNN